MFRIFQKRSINISCEDDVNDFIESVRFFPLSTELTVKIVERLRFLIERERPFLKEVTEKIELTKEVIDGQKKMIAEELFGYLTIKADSRAALSRESIPISYLFGFGLAKSIGLSDEQEDEELISLLGKEFSFWIKEIGSFPTGWGKIEFGGDGHIKLLSKDEASERELQQEQVVRVKTRRFKSAQPKVKTANG